MESVPLEGAFIAPIFLRLKKREPDYRMTLNLKELNRFVVYQNSNGLIKYVTGLMTQGCCMASVDIQDAYYTIPVTLEHKNI